MESRRLYTVPEACRLLACGKSTLYREIAAGRLRSLKIGNARRVPAAEVQRYIAARLADASGGE